MWHSASPVAQPRQSTRMRQAHLNTLNDLAMADLCVPESEDDDPAFVALISRVLTGTVRRYEPENIYLVQIDNWFGPRWKGWPAGLGSLGGFRHWFRSLRIPPFHPHRVKRQLLFQRVDSDSPRYSEKEVESLHFEYAAKPMINARHRALRDVIGSGICLWYSSNTSNVDRASLMLYRTEDEGELAWYAGFLRHGEWKIELAKGISPEQVSQLASPDEPI